jgi:hypothetical protein
MTVQGFQMRRCPGDNHSDREDRLKRQSRREHIPGTETSATGKCYLFTLNSNPGEHPARDFTDNEFSLRRLRVKRGRALKLKTIYTTSQKLKTRLSLSSTRTV